MAFAILVGFHLWAGGEAQAAWFAGEALLGAVAAFVFWNDQRQVNPAERGRLTELALRDSEELLRGIFESAPVAMAVIGRGGRPLYWNAEYERQISLFTAADVRTVDTREVYRDPVQRERILRALRETGSVRNEEFEAFVSKEGATFWAIGSMERITFGGEKATLAWLLDVTERKAAEELIRQKEQQLRAFLEASPIGVVIAGKDGRALFSNSRWREIGRISQAQMRSLDVRTLYRDAAVRRRVSRLMARQGRVRDLEIEVQASDGSAFWVLMTMERITFEGQPATLAWFYDFSERKKVEEELRAAKEKAEIATQAKSTFLATMSHEIRTPLNGVIGYADLLARADLEPRLRDYAGIIRSSGQTLLAVINDVLDYSKIEAGHLELNRVPFDLMKTLRGVVALVEAAAAEKGLSVALKVSGDLPRQIVGDPDRLHQVLLNLLGNAVKFTECGSVTLNAELVAASAERMTLRFTVVDTGIGIPPAAVGQLFQRFSQVDSTIGRRYGGTGLGLAICKELVARMDGDIGVESVPGQGSTFWIVAHFERAKALETDSQAVRQAAPQAAISARLLVVDDHAINRDLAELVLGPAGHRVDTATNGDEAIAALAERDYDLILMDLNMPGMDGFETTARIQSLGSPRRLTPVVAMTASAGVEEVERCLAAGMIGHLAKPFDADTLIDQVGAFLRRDVSVRAPEKETEISSLPLLDASLLDQLEQRIGHSKVRVLVGMLFAELTSARRDIAAHLTAGRQLEARQGLHTLVSTTGVLGAVRLSGLCRILLHNIHSATGIAADDATLGEFDTMIGETERLLRARYADDA